MLLCDACHTLLFRQRGMIASTAKIVARCKMQNAKCNGTAFSRYPASVPRLVQKSTLLYCLNANYHFCRPGNSARFMNGNAVEAARCAPDKTLNVSCCCWLA